jgi:hypothetical protein
MIFAVARIHPALMLVVYTAAKCNESAINETLDQAIALTTAGQNRLTKSL